MSIISMTGFGKSESTLNGTTCVIEVRSVNSRFLEISSKIPKNFAYLENDLKAIIKDKLARGSVNLSITLGEGAVGNIPVCYNDAAVAKFVEITKTMQAKYGIAGDIKLEHILAIPEVLQFTDAGADNEAWATHLKNELSKALDGVRRKARTWLPTSQSGSPTWKTCSPKSRCWTPSASKPGKSSSRSGWTP